MKNRLLAIDSGEGTSRRSIIEAFLRYTIFNKGVPAAVISTAPAIMKAYTAILPPRLKALVLGLGSYHMYLSVAQKIEAIHQDLFLDPNAASVIKTAYLGVLNPLRQTLVRDLQGAGLLVILDRSMLSAYAYAACLPRARNDIREEGYAEVLEAIDSDAVHVFLEDHRRPSYNVFNAKIYDLIAPELNIKLRGWYRSLNNNLSQDKKIHFFSEAGIEQILPKLWTLVQ